MEIGNTLNGLGIISGNRSIEIFNDLFTDILDVNIDSDSGFCHSMWGRYKASDYGSNVLNGTIFEGILATLFYRREIKPLYVQAQVAFVPNVNFDFIAYTHEYGPVILSAKTSLRERYKQADLEGMMLRHVHRKSKSYLITMDVNEAQTVNNKINVGDALGIDKVVVATNSDFDDLISELRKLTYIKPEKIDVITSHKIIE